MNEYYQMRQPGADAQTSTGIAGLIQMLMQRQPQIGQLLAQMAQRQGGLGQLAGGPSPMPISGGGSAAGGQMPRWGMSSDGMSGQPTRPPSGYSPITSSSFLMPAPPGPMAPPVPGASYNPRPGMPIGGGPAPGGGIAGGYAPANRPPAAYGQVSGGLGSLAGGGYNPQAMAPRVDGPRPAPVTRPPPPSASFGAPVQSVPVQQGNNDAYEQFLQLAGS
jgi:hypothetical protein